MSLRNNGEFRGFPGGEAARQLYQVGDAVLLQDAGGDGGAVAARAMDGDAALAGNFGDALLQMVQREIQAAFDVLARPFARVADIQ